MARLLRDRYFWYIVTLVVIIGSLVYIEGTVALSWIYGFEEWHLVYMAFQRTLFLGTVAVVAWRFGIKGGLAACLVIGLMVLPHAVSEVVSPWRPDFLAELMIVGAIGVTFSWLIGGRRRAEETLRESEERSSGFMESAPDSITIWDSELNLVGTNEVGLNMFSPGTKKEDVIGKNYLDFAPHAKEADRYDKYMEVIKTGKPLFIDDEVSHSKFGNYHLAVRAFKVGGGLGMIVTDITERKKAEEKIQRSYDIQTALSALLHISLLDISFEEQLEHTIDQILAIPWLTLQSKGAIFLVEDEPGVLVMKAQRGLAEPVMTACARLPFGKCLCGRAAVSGEIEFADHLDKRHEVQYEGIKPHGHYCVPILSGDKVLGIINLYLKEGHRRDEREEEFLRAAADVLAGMIERKQAEEKVKTASLDTIYRLSRAAEYKDEETGAHIQRMSRYSAAAARQMGLDDHMVEDILYAAPMHDIGKIGIPDRILLKPGKLDPDEWDIMKQHTTIGAEILASSDAEFIKLGEVIALTHHERWDGKGYPKGLKGSEIPLVGRITAIADVFDALISKRPYKEAFPVEKSLAIVRENRGSHFDPEVADAFFAITDKILAIKEKYPSLGESPLIRLANKST